MKHFTYPQGKTDMERIYRGEWQEHFAEVIPGTWDSGRFYSAGDEDYGGVSGIQIEQWQLDQHLHFVRETRGEECFPGCHQCSRAKAHGKQREDSLTRLGKPFPEEEAGVFPCPEMLCDDSFQYKSQLLRHLERKHDHVIRWEKYCDVCCFETKNEANPMISVARHRSSQHPDAGDNSLLKDQMERKDKKEKAKLNSEIDGLQQRMAQLMKMNEELVARLEAKQPAEEAPATSKSKVKQMLEKVLKE